MNAVKLLVDMDMLAWYVCLLMTPAGLFRAIRNKQSSILGILTFSAVYILLNATLVQFEQGAVYRYRSVIVAFILLFLDGQAIKSLFVKFDKVVGKATAGGYQLRQ
jgi:hypothetical protein